MSTKQICFQIQVQNTRANAEICLKITFKKSEPRIDVIGNL